MDIVDINLHGPLHVLILKAHASYNLVARRSTSTRVKFIRYYLSGAEELFSDLQALGGAAVVQGKADAIGAP